jgi:hypothetical protein
MSDLGHLLEHVPTLVRAYGRWPSFLYLMFATASPVVCVGLLYCLLR